MKNKKFVDKESFVGSWVFVESQKMKNREWGGIAQNRILSKILKLLNNDCNDYLIILKMHGNLSENPL